MSKEFYENLRTFGGVSLCYSALTEVDFTAAAGLIYTPPERGNFRRINITRTIQLQADATGVIETFQTSAAEVRLPASTLVDATNDSGDGRLFFLKNSGTGTVTVKDYLGNTLWDVKQAGIVIVVGNDNNNWDFYFSAVNINFNNLSNGFVSIDVQGAIEESRSKADNLTYTSFTGNPKKATVVFAQPFTDANYGVTVTGVDRRLWSIESQTSTGFIINSNANQPITSSVYYVAAKRWS